MANFLLSGSPNRIDDVVSVGAELTISGHIVFLDLVTLISERLSGQSFDTLFAQQETNMKNLVDSILCLPLCSCSPQPYLYEPGPPLNLFDDFRELVVVVATEELVATNKGEQLSKFIFDLGEGMPIEVVIRNPIPIVH